MEQSDLEDERECPQTPEYITFYADNLRKLADDVQSGLVIVEEFPLEVHCIEIEPQNDYRRFKQSGRFTREIVYKLATCQIQKEDEISLNMFNRTGRIFPE